MKLQLFIGRLQDLYAQYGDVEVRIDDGKALRDVGDFAPSIADDPTDKTRKVVVILAWHNPKSIGADGGRTGCVD